VEGYDQMCTCGRNNACILCQHTYIVSYKFTLNKKMTMGNPSPPLTEIEEKHRNFEGSDLIPIVKFPMKPFGTKECFQHFLWNSYGLGHSKEFWRKV